ncbi:helix-turn-helix domain-containing protein [Agrobacterium tumefaciens]|jgi:CRP/FNR family transcriptional regulator
MENKMYSTGEYRASTHQISAPAHDIYCLRDVFRNQPAEHLKVGRSLFLEGDEAAHIFEVSDGVLRMFKIIADGRRIITGFLYAGNVLGVSFGKRYLYSAEAVSPVTLRRVTRRHFEKAVGDNDRLRPEMFALVSDEMAVAQDQMVLLSSKSAEERMCTFLLKFLQRKAQQGEWEKTIELPMCRQDIADYLGLTIETVSRTLTKLIKRGVLRIENAGARQAIIVEKPLLLAQLAGDSDDYSDVRQQLVVQGGRHRH